MKTLLIALLLFGLPQTSLVTQEKQLVKQLQTMRDNWQADHDNLSVHTPQAGSALNQQYSAKLAPLMKQADTLRIQLEKSGQTNLARPTAFAASIAGKTLGRGDIDLAIKYLDDLAAHQK